MVLIKLSNKNCVMNDDCTFYQVQMMDIDDERIELSDTFGMVIGTIGIENDPVIRMVEDDKIEHNTTRMNIKKGCHVFAGECGYPDIYGITMEPDRVILSDIDDIIIGIVWFNSIQEIEYIEYDEDGRMSDNIVTIKKGEY